LLLILPTGYNHPEFPSGVPHWREPETLFMLVKAKDYALTSKVQITNLRQRGVAIETFYQSDETGKMKIVVEGVTKDGKLCRGIGNYNVR
jgi:hypothetical protein